MIQTICIDVPGLTFVTQPHALIVLLHVASMAAWRNAAWQNSFSPWLMLLGFQTFTMDPVAVASGIWYLSGMIWGSG